MGWKLRIPDLRIPSQGKRRGVLKIRNPESAIGSLRAERHDRIDLRVDPISRFAHAPNKSPRGEARPAFNRRPASSSYPGISASCLNG